MNVDEMVRYLGIPQQAALAVSNNVDKWPAAPASAAAGTRVFLLPTYAGKNVPASVSRGENRYENVVSIPVSQTTNSVLAMAYGVFGALSFVVLGLAVLVACVIAGHASRYRSYVFLASLVVAYCLAEWWRTYVLNQGIVQFLILVLALWAVLGSSVEDWTKGRWGRFTRSLAEERPRREAPPAPPQT
jgi:lipopolysaccharide export LptBFGC system permease protein LptF